MGAWGGWALAPNTASMGRDNRSHIDKSQKVRQTFKPSREFFYFLRRDFRTKIYCAAARLASPPADLVARSSMNTLFVPLGTSPDGAASGYLELTSAAGQLAGSFLAKVCPPK